MIMAISYDQSASQALFLQKFHFIQCKKFLILLKDRIFRLLQDLTSISSSSPLPVKTESGDVPEIPESFRSYGHPPLSPEKIFFLVIFVFQICLKADRRLFIQSFFDDILQDPGKHLRR